MSEQADTAEHHTVDGALYLCHTDDHYCPDAERAAADAYTAALNTPPSAEAAANMRARIESGTAPRRKIRTGDRSVTEKTENFPALFKSIAARLGIETTVSTDAFGRTDVSLDRKGMEKLRIAAVEHGFDELAAAIDRKLAGEAGR